MVGAVCEGAAINFHLVNAVSTTGKMLKKDETIQYTRGVVSIYSWWGKEKKTSLDASGFDYILR